MSEDIKKIECEEAIRIMLEYLDGELHDHDNESMDDHLESCRSCYSRMEFETRFKDMVSGVQNKAAPTALNDRIKKIVKDY